MAGSPYNCAVAGEQLAQLQNKHPGVLLQSSPQCKISRYGDLAACPCGRQSQNSSGAQQSGQLRQERCAATDHDPEGAQKLMLRYMHMAGLLRKPFGDMSSSRALQEAAQQSVLV